MSTSEERKLIFEYLKDIYQEMLEAYWKIPDKEQAAKEALRMYDVNTGVINEAARILGKIQELKDLMNEAPRKLEEARAREEKRAVTIKGKGSLVVKLIPCGKHCSGCPHGPYAYEVHKVQGRQVWKYLGKPQAKGLQVSQNKDFQARYPPGHEPR